MCGQHVQNSIYFIALLGFKLQSSLFQVLERAVILVFCEEKPGQATGWYLCVCIYYQTPETKKLEHCKPSLATLGKHCQMWVK